LGSTITDIHFFVPGSTTPARVKGFGAVFSSVFFPTSASIQYFGRNGNSLGVFLVPAFPAPSSFSFLGVSFPTAVVSRVRITSGQAALSPTNNDFGLGGSSDLVVMDDFIYGEPIAAPVCPTITVSIPDAFALPSGVLPNTVYIGYAPASSLTLTSTVSGGTGPYNYTWSNGSHASSITVSPTVTTTYTLNVTDANGCPGSASKTVNVIDIRGGHNNDKVIICHKPSKQNNTLTIGQDGVADHLSHGDMLGACTISNKMAPDLVEIELTKELSVLAFPNPTENRSTVRINNATKEKIKIKVTDFYGKLLEQRTTNSTTFQLGATYKPGVYYVEIIQGQQRKMLKLLKTN